MGATITRLKAVLPHTSAGYILKNSDPIWSKIDNPQKIIDLIGVENWTGAIYLDEPTGAGGTSQGSCELMGETKVISSSGRLRHYYRCDSDIGSWYWRADDYRILGPAPNDCAGMPETVTRLKEILPNSSSGYKLITKGPLWSQINNTQKIRDLIGEENWTGAIYIGERGGAGGTQKESCESKGQLKVFWNLFPGSWFLRHYTRCDCNVGTWYWRADNYNILGAAPYDGNEDNDGDGVPNEDDDDPNDPTRGSYSIAKNLGSGEGPCQTRSLTKNPINFSTGNKTLKEIDLVLSGPGLPLSYTRYYNSRNKEVGPLGYGWTSTFSEYVTPEDDKVIFIEADSTEVHFVYQGQGQYISEVDQVRVIESVEDGYRLYEPYGQVRTFDNEGKLTQIIDRNGNFQNLVYSNGKLDVVEDNYGRRLEFLYSPEGYLSFMMTPVGEFAHRHDEMGNLMGVFNPDTTERSYLYDDPNDPNNLTGIINENGIQSANFIYDDQDRAIVSELTGGMHRVEVDYDTGTTRWVTDSLGNTTTFRLKVSRGIARVKSSSGPGCGSCLTGSDAEYHLNNRFQIERSTDAMGYITTHTYDESGNMLTKSEAVGTPEERTTTFTYHPDYNLIASITRASISDPGGTTKSTFFYDAFGNIIEKIETGFSGNDPITRTTTYGYNDLGKLTLIDGPRIDLEDITTFEYYPNEPSHDLNRGMLKKIVNALGHETYLSNYNAFGKPGESKDGNDVITSYLYNAAGRLTSKTTAGITTSFDYDGIGNLILLHLPGERQIRYTYTSANLLEKIEDSSGNSIQFFYDTEGNRIREEVYDQSGVLMRYADFEFDNYNRLQKTIYPDGFFAGREYDETGNLITLTSPNDTTTLYDYDSLNRIMRVTQPGKAVTQYAYDSHDNLMMVTDAEKNITTYVYDAMRRRITTNSPETQISIYHYDEADNLISKTDARGIKSTFKYDALNRLTDIQFPDSSRNVTYIYDEYPNSKGRLTSMIDSSGGYSYQYNAHGRLVGEASIISGRNFNIAYEYNENGEIASITYPSGRVIRYNRDKSGRILNVFSTQGDSMKPLVEKAEYEPFGPLSGFTYGNGIGLNKTFDLSFQLKSIDADNILSLDYSLDPVGNIESIVDNLDLALSQYFSYNDLQQITKAEGKYGTIRYAYDKVGNRLSRALDNETETYSYLPGTNLMNSIDGDNAMTFTHDANGNTIEMGGMALGYGENNRLKKVIVEGSDVEEYVYNGRGQRVIKYRADDNIIYHYDIKGRLIAEMDDQGDVIREYAYLDSEPLAMFVPHENKEASVDYLFKGRNWRTGQRITLQLDMEAQSIIFEQEDGFTERLEIEEGKWKIRESRSGKYKRIHFRYSKPGAFYIKGRLWMLGERAYGSLHIKESERRKKSFYLMRGERIPQERNKEGERIYYLHNDHLSTPQAMTDQKSVKVWSADSLPFGKTTVDEDPDGDGQTVSLNLRFPGQYYDSETNLHYNYHRYYDPQTGRYLTPDPIGILGGINLYTYVANNPVKEIDPYGLLDPRIFELINTIIRDISKPQPGVVWLITKGVMVGDHTAAKEHVNNKIVEIEETIFKSRDKLRGNMYDCFLKCDMKYSYGPGCETNVDRSQCRSGCVDEYILKCETDIWPYKDEKAKYIQVRDLFFN